MNAAKILRGAAAVALCGCLTSAHGAPALIEWRGTNFAGGAQAVFGPEKYGRDGVNYIYSQSTGKAVMTAAFQLPKAPNKPVFFILEAMDDDLASMCRIHILINDQELFEGPNDFPAARWGVGRFQLPVGTLRAGSNQVSIINEETSGNLGSPPWFMVARCALAGVDFNFPPIAAPSLKIEVASRTRPFPEPLSRDHPQPGFKFRGTKGWNWTPEQYMEEIPTLARLKMNFLMNCYSSLYSSPKFGSWTNEWWKPMPESTKDAYAKIIRACRDNGITFCFAFHPQLNSPRPLDPNSAKDFEAFYRHFAWAQSQGVKWFCVSMDDFGWGKQGPAIGGTQHAEFVNTMFRRLRQKDPTAQLLFCPVDYAGDGRGADNEAYLGALASDMDQAVYVFWTGDDVVTSRIRRKTAESYKNIVKHRLFLWDNYPVNDGAPTLHLGPVRGRDADLGDLIDGYMSNPMATQNELNRIPLSTCADYAYNPWAYDPVRSIGQVLRRAGKTTAQRELLAQLVEAYPGSLVTGGGTGFNPVRAKFDQLLRTGPPPAALNFMNRIVELDHGLAREFPNDYLVGRKTVEDDLVWMRQKIPAAE